MDRRFVVVQAMGRNKWSIIDRVTGKPAIVLGTVLTSLDPDTADNLQFLLNILSIVRDIF